MMRGHIFLLSLPLAFICFLLGLWQWDRLQWKEALLTDIAQRCQAEQALGLPHSKKWAAVHTSDWQWQRVRFSGFWVDKKIKFWRVGGFHIVQPFATQEGFILVDRGRTASIAPSGLVRLEAVLYPSAARRFFDPPDDRVKGEWFVRAVSKMAAWFLVAPVFPLMADLSKRCPSPRNQHFNYALTWWLLMALLPLVALVGKSGKKD